MEDNVNQFFESKQRGGDMVLMWEKKHEQNFPNLENYQKYKQ